MTTALGVCAECGKPAPRRMPSYGDREVVLHPPCQIEYDARSEAEGRMYQLALERFHEDYALVNRIRSAETTCELVDVIRSAGIEISAYCGHCHV